MSKPKLIPPTPPPTTPLERVGLPMDEFKDLLGLYGAGSFQKQVNARFKRDFAVWYVDFVESLIHTLIVVAVVIAAVVPVLLYYCTVNWIIPNIPHMMNTEMVEEPRWWTPQKPTVAAPVVPQEQPSNDPIVQVEEQPAPRAELVKLPKKKTHTRLDLANRHK